MKNQQTNNQLKRILSSNKQSLIRSNQLISSQQQRKFSTQEALKTVQLVTYSQSQHQETNNDYDKRKIITSTKSQPTQNSLTNVFRKPKQNSKRQNLKLINTLQIGDSTPIQQYSELSPEDFQIRQSFGQMSRKKNLKLRSSFSQKSINVKESQSNLKNYSILVNQLQALFTPYGPARHQKAIQLRSIISGASNNYNNVNTKTIHSANSYIIQSQQSNQSAKKQSSQNSSIYEQKFNNFFDKLQLDKDIFFESQKDDTKNEELENFMTQIKTLNQLNSDSKGKLADQAKLDKGEQYQRFLFRNLPVEIQDQMNKKQISLRERNGLQDFLQNKWLNFVITSKSMRRDDEFKVYAEELQRDTAQMEEEKKTQQNKKQMWNKYYSQEKEFFNEKQIEKEQWQKWETQANLQSEESGSDLENENVDDYLSEKKKKYSKHKDQKRQTILKQFHQELDLMDERNYENKLIDFDSDYEWKLKTKRIWKKIFIMAKKSQNMGISVEEFIERKVNATQPYKQKGSFSFIEHCKAGRQYFVEKMCIENKEYIYDYDELNMSGLHWSCKRNHLGIVSFLIKKGALINAKNIFNQTCLYLAIKQNNLEIIKVNIGQSCHYELKLLLQNRANPWSLEFQDYFKFCKSELVKLLIKIAQYLDIFQRSKLKTQIAFNFEGKHHMEDLEKLISDFQLIFRHHD